MMVYYVDSGLESCYLPRCLLPLQENGWDGDRTSILPEPPKSPQERARAVQAADVVVFHRPLDVQRLAMMKELKAAGKKVVADNDDTLKHDGNFRFNEVFSRERVARGIEKMDTMMDRCIAEADMVTASTAFLAEEYRALNPNVMVLPNCIDPFLYDEPLLNETEVLRVGITGSIAVTADIDVVEPIVRHFKGDTRVQFVLFSLPPNGKDTKMREMYQKEYELWEDVGTENHPFVRPYDYPHALNELRLDLMIIPRADNYFNRCKSNIKFLEAAMLKIPCIAQSFADGLSPYEVDREDATRMLLAANPEQFISAIERFLRTPREEREAFGARAYHYVSEKYDIGNNAHLWREAYSTLMK